MGYLLAGGVARLTLSLRPDPVGTSTSFITEASARIASFSKEVRHAR